MTVPSALPSRKLTVTLFALLYPIFETSAVTFVSPSLIATLLTSTSALPTVNSAELLSLLYSSPVASDTDNVSFLADKSDGLLYAISISALSPALSGSDITFLVVTPLSFNDTV